MVLVDVNCVCWLVAIVLKMKLSVYLSGPTLLGWLLVAAAVAVALVLVLSARRLAVK